MALSKGMEGSGMKAFALSAAAVAVGMVLGPASMVRAITYWDGGGGDGKWDTGANWSPDGVPSGGAEVRIDNGARITSDGTHGNQYLRVGYGTVNGWVKVTQTAGTATFSSFVTLGPTGIYELDGGAFTTTDLYPGFDGGDGAGTHGTFIVGGGTLTVQNELHIIRQRLGELRVVGGLGTINIANIAHTEHFGAPGALISLRPNANSLSPINVTGGVVLSDLSLSVAFTNDNPTAGTLLTVINKTSPGAITGTFSGLAEGATFIVPGVEGVGDIELQISYNDFLSGSRGNNDAVLRVISAPSKGTVLKVR